jgi:uroporphyrinogen-III synthase
LPPPEPPDALLITSAQTLRFAGLADSLRALPVFAVGARTAAAVRRAGLTLAATGTSNGSAALALAAAAGHRRILHLRGADSAALAVPPGIRLEECVVYRAELAPSLPPEIELRLRAGPGLGVALFSPRSAAHFAALVDGAEIARDHLGIAVISGNAAAAAGAGWNAVMVADRPTMAAVFAAAARLWQGGLHD